MWAGSVASHSLIRTVKICLNMNINTNLHQIFLDGLNSKASPSSKTVWQHSGWILITGEQGGQCCGCGDTNGHKRRLKLFPFVFLFPVTTDHVITGKLVTCIWTNTVQHITITATAMQLYCVFLNSYYLLFSVQDVDNDQQSFASLAAAVKTLYLYYVCRSPVVEQLYWGYCVKATALSTPSFSIFTMASSVSGWTYRKPM